MVITSHNESDQMMGLPDGLFVRVYSSRPQDSGSTLSLSPSLCFQERAETLLHSRPVFSYDFDLSRPIATQLRVCRLAYRVELQLFSLYLHHFRYISARRSICTLDLGLCFVDCTKFNVLRSKDVFNSSSFPCHLLTFQDTTFA